jgi:GDPmannose 4,6-dehydratase
MKKALITGIYGQDGSYIAELLKSKGYEVHGLIQATLSPNSKKIKEYLDKNNVVDFLHICELTCYDELKKILLIIRPEEIYHFAAFHVSSQSYTNDSSKEMKLYSKNINATLNILGISYDYLKSTKIVCAGSCLIYDNSNTLVQNEDTPPDSNSLYGLAKISEMNLVKYYRDKGLHASTAILYNHESSRRKDVFVTKKIVKNLVAIKNSEIDSFTLGNIDIEKDWGYAKDYVFAMYNMVHKNIPKDYILSSGNTITIRKFIELVAKKLNIMNWEKYIQFDEDIIKRVNNTKLKGDCSLANKDLNWTDKKDIEEVIDIMIKNEYSDSLE